MANNSSSPDDHWVSEPFVGEHIDRTSSLVCVVIGSVMILSAVIGNATLIFIVGQNFMSNKVKHMHNLYVINLALDDLLITGYWFTFFVLDLILGYHPVVDGAHCTANAIVLVVLYMVNLDSLVSISFNRYLHVCHHLLYKRVFTLRRTVCWCIFIWVISILISLPPLWGGATTTGVYSYNPKTHVCSYSRDGLTYVKVMAILYTILPPFFIAYFNIAIFRCWKKARMSSKSRFPLARNEEKKKINWLVAKWRARRSSKKAVLEPMSLEASTEGEAQLKHQPQLVADNIVEERPNVLTHSSDKVNVSPAKPNAEQKTHAVHEGDASNIMTVMNPNSFIPKTQVDVTDHVISDSESDEAQCSNSIECIRTQDNAENYQPGDGIIPQTEGDSRNSSEVRDKEEILSQPVESSLHDEAEETETETETEPDETKTDFDSSRHDPTSFTTSSATASPPPSGPQQIATSKRGKDSKKNTPAQNHQRRLRKKTRSREEAFVRSLLVVCILALITFLPYTTLVIVDTYIKLPKEFFIVANLVVFFNNTVNWVVYGAMNPAFRKGYVKYFRKIFNACRR